MNQIVDGTMFIFKSDKMYNNCLYSYKTKFKVLADWIMVQVSFIHNKGILSYNQLILIEDFSKDY